ncbi:DUF6879 family protein [Sinosporangium siamense]|uniref:DUF6879 domain-containing protein n=1 Tax=Sinosporangium siamense TaxID=1367973 RepID=A0A919RJF1_9ACTN|nr:DUF6879 family protein [Sinosporangium siamense]GII93116.1 hypothetical protein Ssi02_33470 [Sinosporangium siamense]
MTDLLEGFSGERLERAVYRAEFRTEYQRLYDDESWKLERRQSFAEPGVPSWEAFDAGDWQTALRLIAEGRNRLEEYFGEHANRGVASYRVRVVEWPLTPYLQWELHLLNLRAECGERIHIVTVDQTADRETSGPFPEIITLGAKTMYRIHYTAQGVGDGSTRFTDPLLIERCRHVIKSLHEQGEDIRSYFAREVAGLAPPAVKS